MRAAPPSGASDRRGTDLASASSGGEALAPPARSGVVEEKGSGAISSAHSRSSDSSSGRAGGADEITGAAGDVRRARPTPTARASACRRARTASGLVPRSSTGQPIVAQCSS